MHSFPCGEAGCAAHTGGREAEIGMPSLPVPVTSGKSENNEAFILSKVRRCREMPNGKSCLPVRAIIRAVFVGW